MSWELIRTHVEEKPALVLIDRRFAKRAPVAQLTRLCWLGVWCMLPTEGHLWNPEESEALDRVENDILLAANEVGHGWAAYVLRICTPGVRELYFYAGGHAALSQVPELVRPQHPQRRIEFSEKSDAAWEWYRSHLPVEQ